MTSRRGPPLYTFFAVLAVSSFVRRSLSGQSSNRKQSDFLACVLEQRKKVKRVAAAEVRRQARVAQAARQAEVPLPTVFSKSRNLSRTLHLWSARAISSAVRAVVDSLTISQIVFRFLQ